MVVGAFEVSAKLNGYVLSDGTQAPWSGVLMAVD